jgi:hypothetical protein
MDKTFDELYEEFFNENNNKFDVKKTYRYIVSSQNIRHFR